MLRAVFFDLVGTLIHGTRPIGVQYAEKARQHGGVRADPSRMEEAFRQEMRRAPSMSFPGIGGLDEVAAAERAWWAALVRGVLQRCDLGARLLGEGFDAFFADLYDHFSTADAWTPYADARPTLERLKRSSLVVGLITNYDTRVYPVLDALGLSALFDSVTIPAVAGAAKPAPAIFQHALRQHGIAADEALYVGDEIGDDYEAAIGAGMRAILIDREGRQAETGLRTVPTLGRLVDWLIE